MQPHGTTILLENITPYTCAYEIFRLLLHHTLASGRSTQAKVSTSDPGRSTTLLPHPDPVPFRLSSERDPGSEPDPIVLKLHFSASSNPGRPSSAPGLGAPSHSVGTSSNPRLPPRLFAKREPSGRKAKHSATGALFLLRQH